MRTGRPQSRDRELCVRLKSRVKLIEMLLQPIDQRLAHDFAS
jgi:hypothetical protein